MATPAGIVVVVHGGREVSMRPVTPVDLPVLRMIPVARAIQRAVGGTGIAVWRHRFAVRGWNGGQASPAGDLTRLLDDIRARYDSVPVFVAGHSMGARAAFRAAGHPAVCAVAGLAPWLPAGKPVGQLAGRRVLLAHGSADIVPIPGRQRPSGWRLDGACCQRPPLLSATSALTPGPPRSTRTGNVPTDGGIRTS